MSQEFEEIKSEQDYFTLIEIHVVIFNIIIHTLSYYLINYYLAIGVSFD